MNSHQYCNLINTRGGTQEQVAQYQQLHNTYTQDLFEEEGQRLDQIAGQVRNELEAKGDFQLVNEVYTNYRMLFSTLFQFHTVEIRNLILQLLLEFVIKLNTQGNRGILLQVNGVFNFVKLQVSIITENQFNQDNLFVAVHTVENHIN